MGLRARVGTGEVTVEVADDRLKDPSGLRSLLNKLGARVVSESQTAFRKQKWDGKPWLRQYPSMGDPFVHVAGILSDVNEGRTPRPSRLTRGPALLDTGRLRSSVSHRIVGPNEVEIGSALPYAGTHQFGGPSSMPVKPAGRKILAKWARRQKKAIREKIGFLFSIDRLDTDVARRPFLGATEALEKDLAAIVERHILGGS